MRAIAEEKRANILKEQFIPDHVFIYVIRGGFRVFDGQQSYSVEAGTGCLARKNRLAKYEILKSNEEFEPILFCFDEPLLRKFQHKYQTTSTRFDSQKGIFQFKPSGLIDSFIQSVKPYYKGVMELDPLFEEVKYQELLLIILKDKPELAGMLFDFQKPGKIDLEEFMTRNYQFNVSIPQFAYLTGRSLSAFKRDFKLIFDDTPSRWLVQRRLQEAHFLMVNHHRKPNDFYVDLGFESLSHFSTAFKKQYKKTPAETLAAKKEKT